MYLCKQGYTGRNLPNNLYLTNQIINGMMQL